MYWYEYIEQCYRRDNINVENVFQFLSRSSSKVPATGFENVTSIKFMDEERLPTVSTCAIYLLLFQEVDLKCWHHLSTATYSLSCKSAMFVIAIVHV